MVSVRRETHTLLGLGGLSRRAGETGRRHCGQSLHLVIHRRRQQCGLGVAEGVSLQPPRTYALGCIQAVVNVGRSSNCTGKPSCTSVEENSGQLSVVW